MNRDPTFGHAPRVGSAARGPVEAGVPLRVLQVSAFFPAHGGGIEAVAAQLAARLPGPDLELTWMAGGPPDEWPAAPPKPGLTVVPARQLDFIEPRLGLPAPLWGPRSLLRLWRAVGAADVVHVHDYLYMPTLSAALAAAVRRRPLVVTQHIGEIPLKGAAARALLQMLNRTLGALVLARCSQAVFVGSLVLEYFGARARLRRPPRLVPNGVDHDLYRPDAARRANGGSVHLLFVGRLVEKKGLSLLQECADLPGARWTFVGGGPLSPAAWGVPGVEAAGRLEAAKIVPLYQQADLLVLPSTGEGFPLVVQEALACGTPVLVSAEVAAAFPARDPRCVFEVELRVPEPAVALRTALAALVADRPRLAAARDPALALSRQWSWDACVASYREIYRSVL